MDQGCSLPIDRVLFQQQNPGQARIMNTGRIAKGTITAILHQDATSNIAQQYCDNINTAARTAKKRCVDITDIVFWGRVKIHAVALVTNIRNSK
jgi:hypothetical protein